MRKTLLLLLLVLAACAGHQKSAQEKATVPAAPPPPPTSVDLAALDKTVDPCTNFYQYACGGWLQKTPIPPDRPGWSRSFSVINERNETTLRGILEASAAGKELPDNVYAKKVGDYYATCMDEAKAETASLATLQAEIKKIDSLKNVKQLGPLVATLHDQGVNVLFEFGSDQDLKDATQVIGEADQGGLGLPDRDYYVDDPGKPSEKNAEIRKAYVPHVAKMLELAGEKPKAATKDAEAIMKLETQLAKASMKRADRRDPVAIYHRLDRSGLMALAPRFTWDSYFEGLGIKDIQPINVMVPDFFKEVNTVLASTPMPVLQAYLRWHLIARAAAALGQAFVDEDFAFKSKNLTGAQQILPRWKRCVESTDGAMGEAVARPFIAQTFAGSSKDQSKQMIEDVEAGFAANLDSLGWMDATTKKASLEKLHLVFNKVGYPDAWRNYDSLEVGTTSYLQNALNAAAFESKRQLNKIGKPVDRSEWLMSPPTVNAYYNPQLNEMVFPAGILQPPFFSKDALPAANYGAMGMVMGHELTHGFDDEGRKFDGKGNLRDWWTPEVAKAYEDKAQCIVDQYSGYQALPGVNLNGKLTLGENIADVGGIKLAHEAYKGRDPSAPVDAAGYTADQRFFLSFAQGWCTNRREQYARMLVTVDPHSPPEFRVNGVVADTPAFAQAFSCKAGSPMVPAKTCSVW